MALPLVILNVNVFASYRSFLSRGGCSFVSRTSFCAGGARLRLTMGKTCRILDRGVACKRFVLIGSYSASLDRVGNSNAKRTTQSVNRCGVCTTRA